MSYKASEEKRIDGDNSGIMYRRSFVCLLYTSGSGKSVCINTLIMSIIYKAKPEDVRLIMVDPKVVELSVYNGIPHLLIPVVTDPKKAAGALNWAVMEMTDRYEKFAELNVRDIKGYNEKIEKLSKENLESETDVDKRQQCICIECALKSNNKFINCDLSLFGNKGDDTIFRKWLV